MNTTNNKNNKKVMGVNSVVKEVWETVVQTIKIYFFSTGLSRA